MGMDLFLFFCHKVDFFLLQFSKPRWNLKNLSRGLNSTKSAKTRFKFSAGLNLETFDMEPTIIKPRLKFKPPLKFFKFGHSCCKN